MPLSLWSMIPSRNILCAATWLKNIRKTERSSLKMRKNSLRSTAKRDQFKLAHSFSADATSRSFAVGYILLTVWEVLTSVGSFSGYRIPEWLRPVHHSYIVNTEHCTRSLSVKNGTGICCEPLADMFVIRILSS